MKCTLSIWSDFRPKVVLSYIDIEPDSIVIKGAEQIPPRGVPKQFGYHFMASTTDSEFIEDVFEQLIARLPKTLPAQLEMLKKADPAMRVHCFVLLDEPQENTPLLLTESVVSLLASFGSSFEVAEPDKPRTAEKPSQRKPPQATSH